MHTHQNQFTQNISKFTYLSEVKILRDKNEMKI